MAKDYYAILGVERDASPEAIKRAFRRLARETHPDANPGDAAAEARFREVAEAYEVLSDPQRRRAYDRGDTVDLSDLFSGFGSFDDLLRSVFGDSGLFGGPARRGPAAGRDILVRVDVDLAEAAFGTEAEVSFRANVPCEVCGGNGAAPGTAPTTCPTCSGTGAVRTARRSLLGTVMSVGPCGTCSGVGTILSDPCERCAGMGVHPDDRTVQVEIPSGVSTGTRLRLNREGEAAPRGGRRGDLYVEVAVRPDPRFERMGQDLLHVLTIPMEQAALGVVVEVPTIDGGTLEVKVPAGTQPGWTTRFAGVGMTRLGRRGRGDLLVRVDVAVPRGLTSEEADLLRRFSELRAATGDPR